MTHQCSMRAAELDRYYIKMPFYIYILLWSHLVTSFLSISVVDSTSPFLQNRTTPGREWKMVGYLDRTDPTQQCPNSWQTIASPKSSCGKKSTVPCDSFNISTTGATYQTVCGKFKGYSTGDPNAFRRNGNLGQNIETFYADGVTVTYGPPGNRHHVYTYAMGDRCPCTAGGYRPPPFVGSDYYCQCGPNGNTCCNSPDLPWFCTTLPTPISENLEVRICTDQGFNDENVAIESFELYIQGEGNFINVG